MLVKRNSRSYKLLCMFVVTLTLFTSLSISLPNDVHAAGTTLVTYPNPPGGAALNTDFTVKVRANGGAWQDLDEYDTTVGGYRPAHASFVTFDTDGPVDVSVTYNAGTVSTAKVRPASRGITPAISGNTITFTISGPTKLTVDVNGDTNHNLHLFANPLEVNPPSPSDPNVIYLAPGVYNQDYVVPSGKTLYIAGGAIVRGGVFLDGATNAAVRGRGILDHPGWRGISVNYAENITVDGIIVNDYGMGGGGGDLVDLQNANNVTVNNIKGFSYKSWTDGIDNLSSTNITINDSFVRSGDDSMAIYGPRGNAWGSASNQTVTNMLLIPDVARPINFGTHGDASDIEGGVMIDNMSFSNIDILLNNNAGSPMFPIQFTNNAGNLIQNIQFTDIRIEDDYVHSIFNINNTWTNGENGPGRGIKNIYFKNISYTGDNYNNSNLTGYSSNRKVQDVTFENLRVNGNLILDPASGHVSINGNTSNIQFVAAGGASYTPIPAPTPLYTNLALTGTASSDSELPGHPASGANDGNYRTDWTANDTNTGHWWQVDLGSSKSINGTKVIWNSNSVNYLYKVEVSTDNTNWTTVVDKTGGNGTAKTNNDFFNATARYVRITVTGLSAGASAGFNEFRVYGYNGTSLVKNGDFENGNTAVWTTNGVAGVSASFNSTYGLDLTSSGKYAEQTITGLTPNTAYILTVDAKGVSGTGQGYVYVKDYGASQLSQGIISDNSFHSTTINFVTGPTSTSATIGVSSTAGRIQFDNFAVNQGPVLIQNGNFETGNTSGWTGAGLAAYTYAAANGSYGLQLTNPGNYAEQTITGLSPNTSYVLTVNTKGVSGTGQGYVYVKNYGGTQINRNVVSDNNWHGETIYFVTGPTSTSVTIGASCTATRVQFDDFSLNRGPVLVQNGNFESGNTAGWTGSGLAAYTYAAANGSYGLQLTNPGNYAEQTITGLTPNTTYTLTVNTKGVSGTGQGYVYVKNYGGTQINQNITSNNNWNSMTITFTTGAASTTATIGAYCTATRVQFDDFVLNPS